MNRPHSLFTAGLYAAGAIALANYNSHVFAQDQSADKAPGAGGVAVQADRAQAANLPSGVTRSDIADEAGIRSTLFRATEAAVKENGLSDLTMYLASSDRARFSTLRDTPQYDQSVQKLRQAFKDKYNQELAFKDTGATAQSKDIVIVQGEVTNPALLSNWPVDNTAKSGTGARYDRATPGAPGSPSTIDGSKPNEAGTGLASRSFDRGMKIAVVTFPAKQGAPELNVSLIREGTSTAGAAAGVRADAGAADANARVGAPSGDWKIDLPDSITADKLQTSLSRHIDMITNMKDQWPTDANEASCKIARHVMMALYDVGGTSAGATGAGANPSGQK